MWTLALPERALATVRVSSWIGFSILFLAATLGCVPADAAALSNDQIAAVRVQTGLRRASIWQIEAESPFPSPNCGAASSEQCILGKLNHALVLFAGNRNAQNIVEGNAEIADAVTALPNSSGFNTEESAGDGEGSAQPFHFMRAGLLYRIVRLYGLAGSSAPRRLIPSSEQSIQALFWSWAKGDCRSSDANAAHLWTPWMSENHDAQHDATCWEAADLFRRSAEYKTKQYDDGTFSAAQYAAWSSYLKSWIRERARWGLVEYFSPTYARYTLDNVYIYNDFSDDPQLRNLAHEFLDLWWAEWAQEQVDGVFGGTAARVYLKAVADDSPLSGLSWMYFGKGGNAEDVRAPGVFPLTFSEYRPADVIVDIALDAVGRGTYTVDTRAPGLGSSPGCRTSRGLRGTQQCSLDPRADVIRRTAYVTSGFVMGTPETAKLPADNWFAGSSQDRDADLVMAGGDPRARIVVFPLAVRGGGKHYDGIWAVQSKGTQIAMAAPAPYSKNIEQMRVWFGAPLQREEKSGWVFVHGAAYAAVRPAFGGYHWDNQDPNWLVADALKSPIIVQAATTDEYPGLAAFEKAVLAAPLTANSNYVEFAGLSGAGRVALSNGVGRINDTPVDMAFGASIRSPFVNQAPGSGHVTIAKGSRTLELDF
jgi:hypothetical protein